MCITYRLLTSIMSSAACTMPLTRFCQSQALCSIQKGVNRYIRQYISNMDCSRSVLSNQMLFLFKIDAAGIKEIQAARKEYEFERRKSLAPHLAWGSKHPQYSSDPNSNKRASWTEAEMRIILHHFAVIEEQCKVTLYIICCTHLYNCNLQTF
jgi:hypothetical protein